MFKKKPNQEIQKPVDKNPCLLYLHQKSSKREEEDLYLDPFNPPK